MFTFDRMPVIETTPHGLTRELASFTSVDWNSAYSAVWVKMRSNVCTTDTEPTN